ncbi:hypothetical protein E0K89_016575 [Aquicoccus sp. SCR17]|nr:hypothetical protein [Carideicomes alvinocaridis]
MTCASGARAALLGTLIGVATLLRAQGDDFAFMPSGGRSLVAEVLGQPGLDVAGLAARQDGRDAWADWAREAGFDDSQAATLAGYAALNFPLEGSAGAALAGGDLSALPPDGKDLAIAQCQFCHSFFTGYLMQKRDETSWLSTFKSPFHAEIPMTETERATFAAYSAINMPLKLEDVPPELRF